MAQNCCGALLASPIPAHPEMMKHPKIERAIAERRAEYAAASQVTKRRVIDGFESIEMAKIKADPLTNDRRLARSR